MAYRGRFPRSHGDIPVRVTTLSRVMALSLTQRCTKGHGPQDSPRPPPGIWGHEHALKAVSRFGSQHCTRRLPFPHHSITPGRQPLRFTAYPTWHPGVASTYTDGRSNRCSGPTDLNLTLCSWVPLDRTPTGPHSLQAISFSLQGPLVLDQTNAGSKGSWQVVLIPLGDVPSPSMGDRQTHGPQTWA